MRSTFSSIAVSLRSTASIRSCTMASTTSPSQSATGRVPAACDSYTAVISEEADVPPP